MAHAGSVPYIISFTLPDGRRMRERVENFEDERATLRAYEEEYGRPVTFRGRFYARPRHKKSNPGGQRDRWFFRTKQEADDYAENLRNNGYTNVKVYHAKSSRDKAHPPGHDWMVFWGPWKKRNNPTTTTLRNMASVTIRKLPNGVVKITGRHLMRRK